MPFCRGYSTDARLNGRSTGTAAVQYEMVRHGKANYGEAAAALCITLNANKDNKFERNVNKKQENEKNNPESIIMKGQSNAEKALPCTGSLNAYNHAVLPKEVL